MDEKKKSLASSEQVVTAFAASMIPFISLQITPHLEKYIEERLKLTFEEDPAPYREFIRQWGTHFFHKANFGGLIRVGTGYTQLDCVVTSMTSKPKEY